MPQPNMKKEYRAELRSVNKQLARLTRETRAAKKEGCRQVRAAQREHLKRITALIRDFERLFRRHERAGERLVKRQQILEGRLS
jgi:hypothetical protein